MDLYAENILDHYRTPRGKELLVSPTVRHEELNVSCGDTLTIGLAVADGKITGVGWQGSGCAVSQAAMSMLSEELQGMAVRDAMSLTPQAVYDLLGVPIGPRRVKCALLCLHALKNALRVSDGKSPQSWVETVVVEG